MMGSASERRTGIARSGALSDAGAGVRPAGPGPAAGAGAVEGERVQRPSDAKSVYGKRTSARTKLVIGVGFAVAVLASLSLGRYTIQMGYSPLDTFRVVWMHFADPAAVAADKALRGLHDSVFVDRMPRIVLVLLVGAALSCAGAAFQGMFRNPLVSPDLLGASSGASLGACLAMLFGLGDIAVQAGAFCGGLAAVGITVWMRTRIKADPILGLVLAGMLVSSLFSSGMSFVKLVADTNNQLPSITYWLMGMFSMTQWKDVGLALVPMAVGFALLISQSWNLNIMSFGDEEARSMGVNTRRCRLIVIVGATLLSSASVAVAGIIGWVGLVIPHFVRAVVGPNYKALLPACLFVGSTYLLLVDDIARLALSVEIPIGILTAVLGVPFFLVIFGRASRGW